MSQNYVPKHFKSHMFLNYIELYDTHQKFMGEPLRHPQTADDVLSPSCLLLLLLLLPLLHPPPQPETAGYKAAKETQRRFMYTTWLIVVNGACLALSRLPLGHICAPATLTTAHLMFLKLKPKKTPETLWKEIFSTRISIGNQWSRLKQGESKQHLFFHTEDVQGLLLCHAWQDLANRKGKWMMWIWSQWVYILYVYK